MMISASALRAALLISCFIGKADGFSASPPNLQQRLSTRSFGRVASTQLAAFETVGDSHDSTAREEQKKLSFLIEHQNSFVLGALFAGASYGLLHNDIEKIASLPANVDHFKASVTMLENLPTEWLAWYDDKVLAFPLATKASTSGACYFVGDLFAQTIAGKNVDPRGLELDRALRSGLAGFIGHGPVAHYWLGFLDQNLSFDGAWWAIMAKISLDQGPMSIVYNTIYSLLLGAFALRNPIIVLEDVAKAFWPGFLASIKFWPIVHLVTFSVIPPELQLLWVDAAEIVWICILSGVNNDVIQAESTNEIAEIR